jgi:hypothetical protein
MSITNIIIMSLLLSSVINLIKRKKPTTLNCGIFAWTGVTVDQFNPFMFNFLGKENDRRGGDSCGVFFNKGGVFGIGPTARYEELTKINKLHSVIKPVKYPIAIGHCRKCSSGAINLINTQPTIVRNGSDKDKIYYIQAHNGNFTGYKEIAKKYNVSAEDGESDSVVMARVIAKEGFKILKEYEGSAALVMQFTKEPNTLYVFRNSWSLHYLIFPGSGVYISSEASPLEFIGNGKKAIEFDTNTLYKIEKDTVTVVEKVDRDTVTRKAISTSGYYGNRYCDGFDEDNWYWKSNRNKGLLGSEDTIPFSFDKKDTPIYIVKRGVTKNIFTSQINSALTADNLNAIRYQNGYFKILKEVAHGKYTIDNWGFVKHEGANTTFELYDVYFFYGILLYDSASFETIVKAAKQYGIVCFSSYRDVAKFNKFSDLLKEHAIYPFTRINDNPNMGYMEATDVHPSVNFSDSFYTGMFTPLFSDYELVFKAGDFIGYRTKGRMWLMGDLLENNKFLRDYQFGSEEQDPTVIESCKQCRLYGFDYNGTLCKDCTEKYKENMRDTLSTPDKGLPEHKNLSLNSTEEDDTKTTLITIIDKGVTELTDQLNKLIDDVDASGFGYMVVDELDVLNKTLDDLAKIYVR